MPRSPDAAGDPKSQLRRRVAKAPTAPGVYRWLDAAGTVLYVGKAKDLRSRMRSYVQPNPEKTLGPWKLALIERIVDFEVTVAGSELEALVLETNLIKQLKPKYNVLMKDDKNYVYVRVTVQDPYPRIDIVRKMEDDGAKYFGPKTSAEQAKATLNFLRKIFPYRNCKMDIDPASLAGNAAARPADAGSDDGRTAIPLEVVVTNRDRPTPCLDFHIGQCSAPCIGNVSPERYRAECIDGVLQFLRGDHDAVAVLLQERMKAAAAAKKFEQAAKLRDQLASLDNLAEKQLVSDTSGEDADFVGVALLSNRAHVVVLQERGGKVVGESSFTLQGGADDEQSVLSQFLTQFYADAADVPGVIAVGREVSDPQLLEQWLAVQRGKKVQLRVPERGKRSKLLELATRNALEKAKQAEAKWEADARNATDALGQLQEMLSLPDPPKRIEGYDISHLGGTETVGSMTVVKNGKPANDQYRSFTIRSVRKGDVDDYRSIQEVLRRRLRHLQPDLEEKKWNDGGVTFGKALKAEAEEVLRLIRGHPHESPEVEAEYKEALVARSDGEIAGLVRLHEHPTGLAEMRSLWIAEAFRGQRLGQFLARKLLKSVKKGKVYIVVEPQLEEYYALLGFRHVLKAPPVLQERMQALAAEHPDAQLLPMVYDAAEHRPDPSLSEMPDLLVIDGGKGQLGVVVDALKEFELPIPVIGLAKREEEVFVPGQSDPLPIPKQSPALFLLMRLRDEAHRSANRHREGRLRKAVLRSELDVIPGVGPQTAAALFARFGTVDAVKAATDAELLEIVSESQLKALRRLE